MWQSGTIVRRAGLSREQGFDDNDDGGDDGGGSSGGDGGDDDS